MRCGEEHKTVGNQVVAMKRENWDKGFHGGETKDLSVVLGVHGRFEAFCDNEFEFSGGLVNGCNEW